VSGERHLIKFLSKHSGVRNGVEGTVKDSDGEGDAEEYME
jgi:hypothetical protein